MKMATFIRELDWKSDARLYRCDPFFKDEEYDHDKEEYVDVEHEYVIVSAVNTMFSGPETYIFPAVKDGRAKDMLELNGSFTGSLDHAQALRNAGYEIKESE